MKILVIDVGGTHIKVSSSDHKDPVRIKSGHKMTPEKMVSEVKDRISGWRYDAVSIGYPGAVLHGHIASEPFNLRHGWIGFDFNKSFDRPVKIINDAAMQALGSYTGGKMLFIGLGTGLGTALIIDGVIEPMELAHLPYKKGRTYEDYIGLKGLEKYGKKKWLKNVNEIVGKLKMALEADYVVLGGGNARLLKELPVGSLPGKNSNAITGGFRLWTNKHDEKADLKEVRNGRSENDTERLQTPKREKVIH